MASVSVGLGFKISKNFQSLDAHYSVSVDVKEDETVQEAIARAEAEVVESLDRKFEELNN